MSSAPPTETVPPPGNATAPISEAPISTKATARASGWSGVGGVIASARAATNSSTVRWTGKALGCAAPAGAIVMVASGGLVAVGREKKPTSELGDYRTFKPASGRLGLPTSLRQKVDQTVEKVLHLRPPPSFIEVREVERPTYWPLRFRTYSLRYLLLSDVGLTMYSVGSRGRNPATTRFRASSVAQTTACCTS